VVDSLWSLLASLSLEAKLEFIGLNAVVVISAIFGKLWLGKKAPPDDENRSQLRVAIFVLSVNFVILVVGYYLGWDWYFPKDSSLSSQCSFFDFCYIKEKLPLLE
jgi:hypothetical protein